MKLKQFIYLVLGLCPLSLWAQPNGMMPSRPPSRMTQPSVPPPAQMPDKDKMSYAIGMYFGNNITNTLMRDSLNVDMNTVLAAISNIFNGQPTKLSTKETTDILGQMTAAMRYKKYGDDEAAKTKSAKFLADFAKSNGVVTLPEGLEYKVLTDGSGAMPTATDEVTVAYRGTLPDGTEFDKNDSFKTPVKGRTIQGWQKILPLMKTGSKWKVVIPSALGYGPRGFPPKIPANSVLIFDMELKSISPKPLNFTPSAAGGATTPFLGSSTVPSGPPPAPPTPVVSGEIIKVPSQEELKHGAKIEVIKGGQTNAVSPQ